ncbi:maleylacetate reductase [Nocardia vinacea]|uniref:maleylacetate reductase n=1 Tax=Nocardia vinacea TaxID=96468 RepID=UPI002E0D977F|nr:maleylacetate reductase [Nocardia vinacea]
MTGTFTYDALPMRVVFGSGSIEQLAAETDRLGLRRVLVLSTPEQRALADRAAGLLGKAAVGVFDSARMHVPVETVQAAESMASELQVDGCVAVGGGSTIGLAKALALGSDLAIVTVPTTYAGSEMTPIWGITKGEKKTTGRDRKVLPNSVIYDPDLTMTLPVPVSGTSGINAIAHAIEALYAPDGSPVIAAMAEQGIRDLADALPAISAASNDPRARALALQGAWLCGACLGATTMGLHHKLCHVLGGSLDLPHAETHAVMLPYVTAFNLPSAPASADALARALRTDDAITALRALTVDLGAPQTLLDLGVGENDLVRIADEVVSNPYSNPRTFTREELLELLHNAWKGRR